MEQIAGVSENNEKSSLSPRKRVLLLVLIMLLIVLATLAISITVLYRTAIEESKNRLSETAKSQARLIEAIARYDKKYNSLLPGGAKEATLSQIREAHQGYQGFGETGEFTLAERKMNNIVFLINHRHYDLNNPKPVPWDSKIAEPTRLALSGNSGVTVGLDYRGKLVIAAHEPVKEFYLGIVAKIDLAEVRRPFVLAGLITLLFAVVLVTIGVTVFFKLTNPIIDKLNLSVESLQSALNEVKALRGILPICSFCKKIRNDDGYWDQVEVYVANHSDADFSHSICPDCMKKNYGEFFPEDDQGSEDSVK